MTPAASPVNAPAARPFAAEGNSASQVDRADNFARFLDDERDLATNAEAAQPAPPPPADTPVLPEPVEVTSEGSADGKSTEDLSTAAAAYQAALNNLNSGDAIAPADTSTTEPAVVNASDAGDATAVANAAKPGATGAAATSSIQTNAVLLVLASASSTTSASVAQVADTEDAESSDDAGTPDDTAMVIAAFAGVAQPVATQAATQSAEGPGEGKATIKPALPDGATPPAPAEMAGRTDAKVATPKDGKQADATQPQGANPASVQANAHPVASAATQTNTMAAAASSDIAAQATVNTASAATQAAAQPASTSSPLTDATRAVAATPPALQSAPAATIQVYSRIIERADGRAQRFDVRLDPAELGRVDIRIEIGADRKVHAVMAVHDSAALTDLMRGQRALERALSDAGIDLADNGLRFEMSTDTGRGGANQQRDGDPNGHSSQLDAWRKFDTASIPISAEVAAAATPMRRSQRLDLVA